MKEMKMKEMKEKMKDLGEKDVANSKKKWYQTITVDADQFGYLKKKKIGDECVVGVKVRKIAESMRKEGDKTIHRITLELRGMDEEKPKSIRDAGHAILDEEYE